MKIQASRICIHNIYIYTIIYGYRCLCMYYININKIHIFGYGSKTATPTSAKSMVPAHPVARWMVYFMEIPSNFISG